MKQATYWKTTDSEAHEVPITVALCRNVPEFFQRHGQNAMGNALDSKKKKLTDESQKTAGDLVISKNAIQDAQPSISRLEKKASAAKAAWNTSQAEAAKLHVSHQTAQTNLKDAKTQKSEEEKKKSNLESTLAEIETKTQVVANERTLFDTLTKIKMEDRPLGRNNNPTSDDLLFAVEEHIQKIEELQGMPVSKCLIILHFLALMGVQAASGGLNYNAGEHILRARLATMLFPDAMPVSDDANISPTSKAKAIGDQLSSLSQKATAEEAEKAEAQRKRERETHEDALNTPATKKLKTGKSPFSAKQMDILHAALTPEQLEAFRDFPVLQAEVTDDQQSSTKE